MATSHSKRKKKEIAYLEVLSSSANFALVKCSSRRKRSRKQKKQLAAAAAATNSAASKFMSVVPDDLLLEIFLRLPNGRSVIQSATVCKRWCSLVINPDSAKFIGRFNEGGFFENKYSFNAAMYDSDTGLWTQPKFSGSVPCDMRWHPDTIYDSDSDLEVAIAGNSCTG